MLKHCKSCRAVLDNHPRRMYCNKPSCQKIRIYAKNKAWVVREKAKAQE